MPYLEISRSISRHYAGDTGTSHVVVLQGSTITFTTKLNTGRCSPPGLKIDLEQRLASKWQQSGIKTCSLCLSIFFMLSLSIIQIYPNLGGQTRMWVYNMYCIHSTRWNRLSQCIFRLRSLGPGYFLSVFLRPESEEGHEDYLDDLGRESGCGLQHCLRSVALLPVGPLFANLDNILPHGRNCDYYNLFVLACKSAFFSLLYTQKVWVKSAFAAPGTLTGDLMQGSGKWRWFAVPRLQAQCWVGSPRSAWCSDKLQPEQLHIREQSLLARGCWCQPESEPNFLEFEIAQAQTSFFCCSPFWCA